MELIQTLQDEVVAKENAIKKAAEDMKFYKLELINREQSYNAMFGANPNVGLIQQVVPNMQLKKQNPVSAMPPTGQKDLPRKQKTMAMV